MLRRSFSGIIPILHKHPFYKALARIAAVWISSGQRGEIAVCLIGVRSVSEALKSFCRESSLLDAIFKSSGSDPWGSVYISRHPSEKRITGSRSANSTEEIIRGRRYGYEFNVKGERPRFSTSSGNSNQFDSDGASHFLTFQTQFCQYRRQILSWAWFCWKKFFFFFFFLVLSVKVVVSLFLTIFPLLLLALLQTRLPQFISHLLLSPWCFWPVSC